MGHKRKYQGEKGGRFTRKDGSKDHDTQLRPAPSHPESPESAVSAYPCSGETALVGRAVKERWPINDTMREALVDRMASIVSDGDMQESIGAGRVMVAMDAQNVKQSSSTLSIGALQINNHPATQPAEVDHDYIRFKKAQLMGVHPDELGDVPSTPLGSLVEARRLALDSPDDEPLPVPEAVLEPVEAAIEWVNLFLANAVVPDLPIFTPRALN